MRDLSNVPEGWQIVRLGELLVLEQSGAWGDEPAEDDPGVRVLRAANLTRDGHIDSTRVVRRRLSKRDLERRLMQDGDLILERSGGGPSTPVGRVALIDGLGPIYCNNFCQQLRVDTTRSHSPYVFRFLWHRYSQGVTARLEQRTTGIRNLDYSAYLSLPVFLPSLPEQQAIATVLDAIDEAIERTDAVIAATERLRDALLHELLTRGVPGWHSRWKHVPGLGTVPADWQVARLGDVAEVLDSRRIPLNGDERSKMAGVYPYYGANGVVDHIDRWIFDEEEDLVLLAEDGGHFDEFRTRPIAYRVSGKCWVNNHVHVLKSKQRELGSFLFHSLVNKDIQPFINGSTRSKLIQRDLLQIKIGFPSILREACGIAGALDGVDDAIQQAKVERDMLRVLRASVADAVLTGRVRISREGMYV